MKNKKIAIITYGITDSTIPLVKSLLENGLMVDLYIVKYSTQDIDCFTGIQIKLKHIFPGYVIKIKTIETIGLDFYCKYKGSHVYLINHIGEVNNKSFKALHWIFKCYVYIISIMIKLKKYDFIDIIGHSESAIELTNRLKNLNIIVSQHEIYKDHLKKYLGFNKAIENAMNKSLPIRLFSQESLEDLKSNLQISYNKVYVIPFGNYYSYINFEGDEIKEIEGINNYILFYGHILPYKGLSFLYESTKDLEVPIVIAGLGYDPIIEKMKLDKKYILLNRWIRNNELVTLIKNSKFIVCPYLSASQSGIPQTIFPFKKPLIATNVGSFPKIIGDKYGIIVKKDDIYSLHEAIKSLLYNKHKYNEIVDNICYFETNNIQYSWKNISEQYLTLINKNKIDDNL